MSQHLKSSDEPRIVEDSDSLLWETYKTPIIAGLAILLLIGIGSFVWWQKQTSRNLEALALYSNANTVEAWKNVSALYPKTPSAALALIQLASSAQNKGEFSEAASYYETFLKDFPKHPAAAAVGFAHAQLLQAAGKTAEAKSAYETLAKNPDSAFAGAAAVTLARLYQSEKDTRNARQVLEAYTSKAPTSSYSLEAQRLLASLGAPNP